MKSLVFLLIIFNFGGPFLSGSPKGHLISAKIIGSRGERSRGTHQDKLAPLPKSGLGHQQHGQLPDHHPIVDEYEYLDDLDDEDFDALSSSKSSVDLKTSKGSPTSSSAIFGSADHARNAWEEQSCPQQIRGRCHCGLQRDVRDKTKTRYVVNCTNAGFTSAEPLKYIPDETVELIVRRNKIRELPLNLFGRLKEHKNLRLIDLSENEIEDIKGKTFHKVSSVETLILNFNKINPESLRIHPRLFSNFVNLKFLHLSGAFELNKWLMADLEQVFKESNLTKLEKLHLEQNHIVRIPHSKQFCDLPSLMDLHLGQNKLTDLVLEIECLQNLRLIDLSFNEIKTVRNSSGLYNLLEGINGRGDPIQVDLYENPFKCDCELDAYLKWLKETRKSNPDRIRHGETLRCETGLPETNRHLLLYAVANTTCPILLASTNHVINTLSWTLLSLIIIASVVLLTSYYFYKVGLPSWVQKVVSGSAQSPLLMTTQGVKYTSIEKEEVAEVAHV